MRVASQGIVVPHIGCYEWQRANYDTVICAVPSIKSPMAVHHLNLVFCQGYITLPKDSRVTSTVFPAPFLFTGAYYRRDDVDGHETRRVYPIIETTQSRRCRRRGRCWRRVAGRASAQLALELWWEDTDDIISLAKKKSLRGFACYLAKAKKKNKETRHLSASLLPRWLLSSVAGDY